MLSLEPRPVAAAAAEADGSGLGGSSFLQPATLLSANRSPTGTRDRNAFITKCLLDRSALHNPMWPAFERAHHALAGVTCKMAVPPPTIPGARPVPQGH